MLLRLGLCLRLVFLVFLVLLVFPHHVLAQYNGLIFASRETAPEKRTVLNLTPDAPLCFSDSFQIDFDIRFVVGKERYSGYIFRLIDEHNENLDLLFDGRDRLFKVVYKEGFTKIVFAAPVFDWNRFRLRYDHRRGISFWVNDKLVSRSGELLKDGCLRIFFGANYYHGFRNTDLPSMEIKNLAVEGGEMPSYFWQLNELEGAVASDSLHNQHATVLNPVWVRSQHERWEATESFTVNGNPSIAFDSASEQLFIVNNDSLYTYANKTNHLSALALKKAGNTLPAGNQSIYYPAAKKLYNLYPDKESVPAYNFETGLWEPDLPAADRSLTAYWHANKFISSSDSALYIIGGYGFNKYKNLIRRYDLHRHTWDTIKARGDLLEPRYLSALGQNAAGDTAWLLGGYGSQSGDQMLSPRFYYDLYVFDVRNRQLKRLFTLKEPDDHFVFANSLIINTAEQSYYALTYPRDRYDSRLQLIHGSLKEPSYELLGDQIPYWFNDAKSFSDLFYCPSSQQLMVVTITHTEDQTARITIYTIAAPPIQAVVALATASNHGWVYIIGGIGLVLLLGVVILVKRKGVAGGGGEAKAFEVGAKALGAEVMTLEPEALQPPKPHIYLFGNLSILDQQGGDITSLLTPLQKELFLLILLHTLHYKKGVSLEKLNATFWGNMDERNAKNNRAVNIGKLKSFLERLGDCTLKKEAGCWIFAFDAGQIEIDFARFKELQQKDHLALLEIIQRGPFLPQENYEWLDDIKSDLSNTILNILQTFSTVTPTAENAEFLIGVAGSIFTFDELNEEALVLKCKSLVLLGRHAIAINVFEKFAAKYKDIYGEEFKWSYTEITAK